MTLKEISLSALSGRIGRAFGVGSADGQERIGKFVKNSSFQLIATLFTSCAAFLQTILIARYLGVGNYGILALVMTYTQFVGQFISCNMWEVIVKYGADFIVRERREEFLATVKLGYLADTTAGILALSIVLAIAGLAATRVFHAPAMTSYVYAYSPILLLGFLDSTSEAVLRVHSRFDLIARRDMFMAIVRLVAIWTILILSPGLLAVILTLACSAILQTGANLTMASRLIGCGPLILIRSAKLSSLKEYQQKMKAFVLSNYFALNWSMLIANSDMIFLGHFRTASEVGIYRMAKNFYNIIARFVEPFQSVMYPELARLWAARSYRAFLELVKLGTTVVFSVSSAIGAVIFFFIPSILRTFAGEEFAGAVGPTRLLALGAWMAAIFFWTRPAVLVMGKPHIPTVVNFFNAAIVILLSFIIVPKFGAIGSAAVLVVAILFGNLVVGLYVFRNYRVVVG